VPTERELEDLLRHGGFYLEKGHYLLSSGKHSDVYVQARVAMMFPDNAKRFAEALEKPVKGWNPTCLAASTIGGILLADELAKPFGCPVLIGRPAGRAVQWINLGSLPPSAKKSVIIVDDVLTTGGTLAPSLSSLEQEGFSVAGVAIAVNRSEGEEAFITSGSHMKLNVASALMLHLKSCTWDASVCPIDSSNPDYINLHNPEEDPVSVLISMPKLEELSQKVLNSYSSVYTRQQDHVSVEFIGQLKTWLPAVLQGLPMTRIGEDSSLTRFLSAHVVKGESVPQRKTFLIELVGHMLAMTQVRIESRSVGCTALIGEWHKLEAVLEKHPVIDAPPVERREWNRLVPYYDSVLENESIFLFTPDGDFKGVWSLMSPSKSHPPGIRYLLDLTANTRSLALVVRRQRKAVSVYRDGRLQAVAELSAKTGLWEFSTPGPTIEEVNRVVPNLTKWLEYAIEVGREMIARGYGGMFVIGPRPVEFQKRQTKPPIIQVKRHPFWNLDVDQVVELAKVDGAVFISEDGWLEAASVIIVNKPESDGGGQQPGARELDGGGARRNAAIRTSIECPDAVVVCVSQAGTMDIMLRGGSRNVAQNVSGYSAN